MIIRNGLVFTENLTFDKKELYIENDIIKASADMVSDDEVIDAAGCYVIPGLIDIHSHGAVGCDFSDGNVEGLKKILEYQYQNGITSYCPTSMSLPKDKLLDIFKSFRNFDNTFSNKIITFHSETLSSKLTKACASIVGINMEGPFLDSEKKGAHKEEYLSAPDINFFRECNEACGNFIRLVTLAPNLDGAVDFTNELKNEVTISLGHTSADYDISKQILNAGANHITHLFNAMMPMGHRSPGLITAAAEQENCYAELICDGVHVHESMIRMAFRLFPNRIVLISDSMRATGMKNGTYELGGQQVSVNDSTAALSDGTIAGSVTNLFDCMKKAVSFGIPLEAAVAAATMNPAKSIGIFDEVGSLSPGKKADILILDKNLTLVKIL